jgi:hypothetical protein
MRWFGTRSALVATAVTVAGLAPGAGAAVPDDPPARTIVSRATCADEGRVVVRKTDRGDHTHVTVDGYGVPDRRWTGEYWVEVGVDDTNDVWLEFRSRDGRFHQEFDVDGTGTSASLDLLRGKPQACFAAYTDNARYTVAHSTGQRVLVRHGGQEQVGLRGSLDCRVGTRWRIEVTVEFADQAVGFETAPRRCRRGWIEFGAKTEIDTADVERPVAITLVGRGPRGELRRAEYRPR